MLFNMVTYNSVISIMFLLSPTDGFDDFLKFPDETKRSTEICCNDNNLLSCTEVKLDPTNLSKKKITLKGIQLTFSNFVEPNGYDYKSSQGDEAILSFNKETGNMFGSLTTHEGRSFAIEKCHHGHVWKEFNVSSFGEDTLIDEGENRNIFEARKIPTDMETIVTYSVMFYYTPEFAAATADIEGYIDQVIDETNEGYINSLIPLRVKKFCTELASYSDKDVWEATGKFRYMNGKVENFTKTADAGALLTLNNANCGYANGFNGRYATSVRYGSIKSSFQFQF